MSTSPELSSYVSNVDRPVYALRNLPPEVTAVLFAFVSRSSASFRDNLKTLLQVGQLEGMSSMGAFDDARASAFHEKWVLGYGHSSVAEHADLHFAIDELSILAAKILEDNRLAAYTEKSSRYQVFDANRFHWPVEIKGHACEDEARTLIEDLFTAYQAMHDPVRDYLTSSNQRPRGLSGRAWKQSLHAATCDVIRYLLPAGSMTSLAISVNARSAAHLICKARSFPLDEIRQLGHAIEAEGTKVTPVLLKYAEPNPWQRDTHERMRSLVKEQGVCPEMEPSAKDLPRVRLIDFDSDALSTVLADWLYEHGQFDMPSARQYVKELKPEAATTLLERALEGMTSHDRLPRAFEQIMVTVEFCVDYGAFRDLQRHRMGTQTNPLPGCAWGWECPDVLLDMPELEASFDALMQRSADLWKKLVKDLPDAASYFVPMAFKKRFSMKMNLREAEYLVQLRSGPAGHTSYRSAAQDLHRLMCEAYPEFKAYFRANYEEPAFARAASESRLDRKLNPGADDQ
jgi:thymidylate synthase ThyX